MIILRFFSVQDYVFAIYCKKDLLLLKVCKVRMEGMIVNESFDY